MPHISKRRKAFIAKVDPKKTYAAAEALKLVKETATAKFDEAIDVAVNLGKKVRVAVFAPGDKGAAASAAGADIVGMEDLAEQIKAGKLDFDVVIAAPEAMRVVGQLGQILGPRGLMPNPKVGTVTADVAGAVKNAKAGQVQFRADKSGVVQCTIGRASFTPEQLRENLTALVDALNKAKPAATKGVFLKKLSVSSTMGLGVKVDPASLHA